MRTIFVSSLLVSSFCLATISHAQEQCGEIPVAPELVDGSSVEIQELAENSRAVNGYVEAADTYLDCAEDALKKASGLSPSARNTRIDNIKDLTATRNNIGDLFNEEVAKYRVANPE